MNYRTPSGESPAPFWLIPEFDPPADEEPLGRSTDYAEILVRSPHAIDRCIAAANLADVEQIVVFELDGARADRIAGSHVIAEWTGGFDGLRLAIAQANAAPRDGRPRVMIITGTEIWEDFRVWLKQRVKAEAAEHNVPMHALNFEIPHNLWDSAKSLWSRLLMMLRDSDWTVLMTCRAVERFVDGPDDSTVRALPRYEIEKSTPKIVDAVVPAGPVLLAALNKSATQNVVVPPTAGPVPLGTGVPGNGVPAKEARRMLTETIQKALIDGGSTPDHALEWAVEETPSVWHEHIPEGFAGSIPTDVLEAMLAVGAENAQFVSGSLAEDGAAAQG